MVHTTLANYQKQSKLEDDKAKMITFTQFCLQMMTLKLADTIEDCKPLWENELERDDRNSLWCGRRKDWLLEEDQGIDITRRSEKGAESRNSQVGTATSKTDLAAFKADTDKHAAQTQKRFCKRHRICRKTSRNEGAHGCSVRCQLGHRNGFC